MQNPLSPPKDAIIAQIRKGDKDAFQMLFDQYWQKLYVIAYRKLRCHESARDLVQDLFISIWLKRETIQIQQSLEAYLFTALRYRIINQLTSQSNRKKHMDAIGTLAERMREDVLSNLQAEEINHALTEEISHLPERMRQVFELSRLEGLSTQEIACRLDITDRTVKNQISNALKILRRKLHHFFTWAWLLLYLFR